MYNAADVERIVEIVLMVLNLEDEGWTFEKIQETLERMLEGGTDEPGPDEPEPEEVDYYMVVAPKVNARFAWKKNAAGRPIMQIYPADNAPVRDRVQYMQGTMVQVDADIVKADGGGQYVRIVEKVLKNGALVTEPLYLQLEDGVLE